MNATPGREAFDTELNGDEHVRAESAGFAIVGMAGRFPGADDVAAFWQRIKDGDDLVSRFAPEDSEDSFTDEERARPDYVSAKPMLAGVEDFDARFFGMYAREAELTDPQARILLELAWQALEDAGCDPRRYPGAIGVWAGCSFPTYFIHNVLADRATAEAFTSSFQVGMYPHLMGAITDTLATRIAYKLDLRGPAITVHTACSTSLTAVAEACEGLARGHCDVALAGGVSITFPQRRGYFAQDGGMTSPDGTCRPFDADANGTVFGHGAGLVVLKRLEDAIADRDRIHAVVLGAGLNNDGADKVAFTAPSVGGQAEAIRLAHASACVDPADIGYVECHGTATPLGDPIEFQGLAEAFGQGLPAASCALGSAKANLGHLDAAAGVVGLIKAALMVRDGVIPPLRNHRRVNPAIALDDTPFHFPTTSMPWPNDGRRRMAGVSSFGVGGTNVHVVLEEPPQQDVVAAAAPVRAAVIPLSAGSVAQLGAQRAALAAHLEANPGCALADVAFTLQEGRAAFAHRFAIAARTHEEAVAALRDPERLPGAATKDAPPVVFLFPGQGAQHPAMARGLYKSEPVFAHWIERGLDILDGAVASDVRRFLLDEPAAGGAVASLGETAIAQPALFLTEYALAALWQARGVTPAAMVGHSVGEFAAAAFADVLSFEDALGLIAARGRLMQAAPRGAMLSVREGAARLRGLLVDGVDIAADNGPRLSVLAGPDAAIAMMEAVLAGEKIASKRLQTSHAFHSAMMDGVVDAIREAADGLVFAAPTIPIVSSVTGRWLGEETPWTADYVARHCRETVAFAPALRTCAAGIAGRLGPGGRGAKLELRP